jgi:hypothetical protein
MKTFRKIYDGEKNTNYKLYANLHE